MRINISPNYTDEKLDDPTIDDLIDIFEDRIKNWLLEPAKKLMNESSGPIPAFCLLLTYFEGIWIFKKGEDSKNKSKLFFMESFVDVFKSCGLSEKLLMKIAEILYIEGRCGFFHDGMFRAKIFFKRLKHADMLVTLPKVNGRIDENGDIQSIIIDPFKCMEIVQNDFSAFVKNLRDSSNTIGRESFQKICKIKWKLPSNGIFIGMEYDEFMKT